MGGIRKSPRFFASHPFLNAPEIVPRRSGFARDTRLDRVVAIKFSHAQFTERFEREARAIAALNHPNIAQIYDVGENYIVMEYVEGACA